MGEGIGKIVVNVQHDIQITLSGAANPDLVEEAFRLIKDHNSYCRVKFSKPYKARSTGYRSQNSHFYGHVGDLIKQVDNPYLKSKEVMAWCLLCKAVDRGLPSKKTSEGVVIPKPTSLQDTFEANICIETIHQYADEHNYWLSEYNDATGQVYRTRGGRTLEEMLKLEPSLNAHLVKDAPVANVEGPPSDSLLEDSLIDVADCGDDSREELDIW